MPGNDVACLIRFRQIDIFDDSEIGTVNRQRHGVEIVDHHVAAHVFPLIDRAAQLTFLIPRPRMPGLQSQFVIDIHFMPWDFVDPNHRALRLQVVQFLPQPGLFLLLRQSGNFREFTAQTAQHLAVFS